MWESEYRLLDIDEQLSYLEAFHKMMQLREHLLGGQVDEAQGLENTVPGDKNRAVPGNSAPKHFGNRSNETDARKLLRLRLGEIAQGKIPGIV